MFCQSPNVLRRPQPQTISARGRGHHILTSRAHSDKIPTSRSSCSMVLSTMALEVALYRKWIWRPFKPEVTLSQHIGLVAGHIYFRYNATSGDIVDNTTEQLDLKHGYSRWNFVRRCPGTRDNPRRILPPPPVA